MTKTTPAGPSHKIATRQEWLAERIELLKAEKELTRRSDELAKRRQALPWVRIEKNYTFETDQGKVSLADLFQGRSQLLVYHFMYGPEYTQGGCMTCSTIADGFNGFVPHLAHHDVMMWAVSRAPLEKIQAYKTRMGWAFPWASSFNTDFNPDFKVQFTEQEQRDGSIDYNYAREEAWDSMKTDAPQDLLGGKTTLREDEDPVGKNARVTGTDVATYTRERPGMSAFILDGGTVYHTYSAYSRGLDGLWGMYQWLDRAPKGRNETGAWWMRRDEYLKD